MTDDLRNAEKKASDETKEKLDAEDAERRKKRALQNIIAKRRDHYLRKGASVRIAAVRHLVAKNDPVGLDNVLDRRNPNAPASSAGVQGGDEVLTQPLVQSADTEGLITLHQLAVERNPRNRGRPPTDTHLGDTAAYLETFPMSDELPGKVVPWQRTDPEPKTLKMVRSLHKERDEGYSPFLPPQVYWDNREAAIELGLEDTVMMNNSGTNAAKPMWPVETWAEEQDTKEVRLARMGGRKLIRRTTSALSEPSSPNSSRPSSPQSSPPMHVKEEVKVEKAEEVLVVKKSPKEKAEERARERADLQMAELRRGQDAKAWELMRRRSRLKTLQQASLRGRLEVTLLHVVL